MSYSNSFVTLGDFAFQQFEVPETISFGGSNTIATHRLSGGVRLFDIMGTEEKDISWSGHILSADAVDRQNQLDAMRETGGLMQLSFGPFSYDVIIGDIDFMFHKINHITYTIKLVVVDNLSGTNTDEDTDLGDAVDNDVGSASSVTILSTPQDTAPFASTIAQALAPVSAAVQAVNGVISAGSATALAILTNAQTAQSTISGVANTVGANLTVLGSAPTVTGGLAAASFVDSATNLTSQISQINTCANYLGRAINNLQL